MFNKQGYLANPTAAPSRIRSPSLRFSGIFKRLWEHKRRILRVKGDIVVKAMFRMGGWVALANYGGVRVYDTGLT